MQTTEQGAEPNRTTRPGRRCVKVNGNDVKVHRGSYLVSEFKEKVKVDASQELDQVIDGQFKPLDDNEHIVIKGGEVFVSHARCGGSS